ncbi:cation:proton antiporter [Bacillus songklensis]|uniref:Cation:proton antiporter n=1 Tax=Bacillus songklensis TaxID=1069116 RepID=A0ABV8B7L9_9BACI
MGELDLHYVFELGLILVIVAAGVTAVAKKFKQPYSIALVIVGALIGLLDIPVLEPLKLFITEGEIFNFVVITLFLPALLGEASLKLPFSHLRENKGPILALAFGGTLLSFLIVGFSAYYLFDFSLTASFVFASLMSATDPISVLSIFKTLGVHKRLSIVVEGESLFNDGLAVVLFKISAFSLLAYIEAGWAGFGYGLWEFVKVISLGIMIGGALGYGFSKLTSYFDDYPLEIIFSVILFYGSFLIAEGVHASGVIAVVVAALIFGNYGARIGMSPTTKLNIRNFWEVGALLANSLVFLMVGLEITRIDVKDKWAYVLAAIVVVLIARSVAVYISMAFIKNFPASWKHIINWGGLKGSLSIALVLSLPRDFSGREDVLLLAFSVVLFSLVFQSLTIKPLTSILRIVTKSEGFEEYEALIARLHRYEAAIREIHQVKNKLFVTEPISSELIRQYNIEIQNIYKSLERLFNQHPILKAKQLESLRKHVLYAEHEAIDQLVREDIISTDIAEKEHEHVTDLIVQLEERQNS